MRRLSPEEWRKGRRLGYCMVWDTHRYCLVGRTWYPVEVDWNVSRDYR
jgi:hypothetical protein